MKNIRIAFDESGNTGQNLLDLNQPFFVLASVNFSNKELKDLIKIFDSKAQELHFKALKKYSKSQKQILELCNHELISYQTVKFYAVDKKVALISHLVDRFIEPVLYKLGKNIYQDRSTLVITNILYTFFEKTWDKGIVERYYKSFQNFMRNPSDDSIEDFYSTNLILYASIVDKEDQADFLMLIHGSRQIKKEIIQSVEPYTIDLTFPTFNVLTQKWYEELNSTFEIIHDDAKAIEFWKTMIEYLANPDKMEEKEVGYGANKVNYPKKYTKIELVNSKDYKQVQIADLLASSICFALKNKSIIKENKFVKSLWDSKLFNIEHSSISTIDSKTLLQILEEGNQEGTSSLDYLAEMHQKNNPKKN